jgi:hypothetical protein
MMKRFIAGIAIFMTLAMFTTGCALIGAALSAGAAYGIYQATRR